MVAGLRGKFFNIYAQKFLPNVKEMEKERQKRYIKLLTTEAVLIFVILYILMGYISQFTGVVPAEPTIFGAILSLLAPFILMYVAYVVVTLPESWNKEFKNEIKSMFLYDLIKVFGNIKPVTDSYYVATMVGLTSSGIFPEYDERDYDDAFVGTYNDVDYAVIESELRRIIEIHDRYGNLINQRKIRLFKGVILAYPCYKRILARTTITPKKDFRVPTFRISPKLKSFLYACLFLLFASIFVFGVKWGFSLDFNLASVVYMWFFLSATCAAYCSIRANCMKRVNVEDVDFEKDYIVKSEDQVEGRYLVTTAFIDRFKKLQKIYSTKNIRCAFWGNTITFAIQTDEDMFELGSLYYSLTDSRLIEKFYDQITSIFDLIDLFKLNEDTKL